jgi:hypothetical protein
MTTGEPRHTSHDEGEWLQAAVEAAIAGRDLELERLARRAAVPLLVRISSPVVSVRQLPALSVETPLVLKLPTPVSYRAELFVSVDGGDVVQLGTHPGLRSTNIGELLPESASRPGLHHLRVTARITYTPESKLPTETRQLPEIVYALYDPDARSPYDARYFLDAARNASVRQLDRRLPEERFDIWLKSLLSAHGGRFDMVNDWTIQPCDARTSEPGVPPRSLTICATAWFGVKDGHSGVGQAWIRTGRIELVQGEIRLLGEPPAFEGLTLRGSEFEELSALPDLLARPPESWPVADISIAPEDIVVTPQANKVQVVATIRNEGRVNVRGALVTVAMTTDGRDGAHRDFLVDVPKNGSATISVTLPFLNNYGVAFVHATPMSEHSPHELWLPDPTPEDSSAFRIVNARQAPPRYGEFIVAQCGPICRGY